MTYKTCSSCKKTLPIDSFRVRYIREDGVVISRTPCRSCENVRRDKRRLKVSNWYYDYKSSLSCAKCGYSKETSKNFTPKALEFHHPQANKEIQISSFQSAGWSIETIEKEILKCVVLCSRCHAEVHK